MPHPQYPRPVHLLLITAFAVFAGEVLVMLLLDRLPTLSLVPEAVLDGALLTVLASPFLYILLFRPMVVHIEKRYAAEESLRAVNETLEAKVADRTAEVLAANERLKGEVSQRAQVQHELVKANAFTRNVIESVPAILLIYDPGTYRCVYVNGRVTDLLGYAEEDVTVDGAKFFKNIFGSDGFAAFESLNEELLVNESRALTQRQFRLRHADGTARPFAVAIVGWSLYGGDSGDVLLTAFQLP